MSVPDACSLYLGKGSGAFALGRGHLHVYAEQELTIRLGLSLLSSGWWYPSWRLQCRALV